MNRDRSFVVVSQVVAFTLAVALIYSLTTPVVAQESEAAPSCELLTAPALLTLETATDEVSTVDAGELAVARFTLSNESGWTLPNVTVQAVLIPAENTAAMTLVPVYASTVLFDSVTVTDDFNRVLDAEVQVPEGIAPGLYEIALVATQGASDAERVTKAIARTERLGSVSVSVLGAPNALSIVDESLTIDSEERELSEAIVFESGTQLPVSVTLQNIATNAPAIGTVSWELYQGAVPTTETLVAEETAAIKLVPEAEKTYDFTLAHAVEAVAGTDVLSAEELLFDEYLLLLTVATEDTILERYAVPLQRVDGAALSRAPYMDTVLVRGTDEGTEVLGCVAPGHADHEFLATASLLSVSLGGEEIGGTLRSNDDLVDSAIPLGLVVGATPGPLSISLQSAQGDVEGASNPAFSRMIVSRFAVTIGCDVHSCVAPVATDTESDEPVSPLKTYVGLAILLIIASLPILGAIQVQRRSRAKKAPIMNDADTDMHPLDTATEYDNEMK